MPTTERTLDELAGIGGDIFDRQVRPALRPGMRANSSPLMSGAATTKSTRTTMRPSRDCVRLRRRPMSG